MQKLNKKIFVVTHTHWDRMWYFTEARAQILLEYHFKEYIKILKKSKLKNFILDGQSLILKDFLEVRPEEFIEIKNLVKEGKLIPGPQWYQNDNLLVRGESIIRNLKYGIELSKKLTGISSNVMYVPDTFGHSFQLPQILNGFNINKFVAYRGWNDDIMSKKDEFKWMGANDSKVFAKMLPYSYGFARNLPTNTKDINKRFDKVVKELDKLGNEKYIIFPNGNDQSPMPMNLDEAIKSLQKAYPEREIVHTSWDGVMEEVENQKNELELWEGELTYGKFSRVHRSFYSSRIDIKTCNALIESKLIDIIEPLSVISKFLKLSSFSNRIKLLWERLLSLQGHDALVSANSDITNDQVFYKLKLIEEECDDLIDQMKHFIGNGIKRNENEDIIQLFNFSPTTKLENHIVEFYWRGKNFNIKTLDNKDIDFDLISISEVNPSELDNELEMVPVEKISKNSELMNLDKFYKVKVSLKYELKGLGYECVKVTYADTERMPLEIKNQNSIENEFWRITCSKNSITFLKKKSNELIKNAIYFESSADAGDEFNYSPPDFDKTFNLKNCLFKSTKVLAGSIYKKIIINLDMILPSDLNEYQNGKVSGKNIIELIISLNKDSDDIKIKINYKNNVKDHRARIIFNTNISVEESIAHSQFGEINRNVVDPAYKYWENNNYKEAPIPIYPFTGYVSNRNNSKSFNVFSKTSREFEIVGKKFDKIAITIFRSIGWMGKPSLKLRPGRPSGVVIETPHSQMLGKTITQEFIINTNKKNFYNTFKLMNIENQYHQVKEHNWFALNQIKEKYSNNLKIIDLSEDLNVEITKMSFDKKEIVVRGTFEKENKTLPKGWKEISLDELRKKTFKLDKNVIYTLSKNFLNINEEKNKETN